MTHADRRTLRRATRCEYAWRIADFFARFAGELSDDDRIALDRPEFKLYEGRSAGTGAPSPGGAESPDYHVVRVAARDADEARQEVVRVLGREPTGLEVMHAI